MTALNLPKSLLFILGITILHAVFSPFAAFSQETQITASQTVSESEKQLNETIRALQKQKQIAELERDIATAKKESLDAEPKPVSTPLKSDVIISGAEIEPDVIVYAEMAKVNAKIGDSVVRSIPAGSTLVIFNEDDFADWKFYKESFPLFKLVIEDLTESFCLLAQKSGDKSTGDKLKMLDFSANLARGGNLIGQFADLLSYFRTETKIAGREVEVDESVLVADLFSKMRGRNNLTLYYPKMFAPANPVFCGTKQVKKPCCLDQNNSQCVETREVYCSETANLFDALYHARRSAFQSNPESQELKKLNKDFDDFNKLFTEKAAGANRSALEKYLNAERTNQVMQSPSVYFLKLESVKAVGKQRIRKNLFFLTDKLDYSGGIIVQWALFDKGGKYLNSGVETSYEGYKTPKQLKQEMGTPNRPPIP